MSINYYSRLKIQNTIILNIEQFLLDRQDGQETETLWCAVSTEKSYITPNINEQNLKYEYTTYNAEKSLFKGW